MFAYLVIGFELAILYSIFWYVFIREPKPQEIRGDDWGRYENNPEDFTAYSASQRSEPRGGDDSIPQFNQLELYLEQERQFRYERLLRDGFSSPSQRRLENQRRIFYERTCRRSRERARKSAVEKLFANFGRAISAFNAKTPMT
jgi:hypothetical protein